MVAPAQQTQVYSASSSTAQGGAGATSPAQSGTGSPAQNGTGPSTRTSNSPAQSLRASGRGPNDFDLPPSDSDYYLLSRAEQKAGEVANANLHGESVGVVHTRAGAAAGQFATMEVTPDLWAGSSTISFRSVTGRDGVKPARFSVDIAGPISSKLEEELKDAMRSASDNSDFVAKALAILAPTGLAKDVNVQNVRLEGLNVTGADLSSVTMKDVTLVGARMNGVDASNAVFDGVTFDQCAIRDARLGSGKNGKCIRVTINGGDLEGSQLSGDAVKDGLALTVHHQSLVGVDLSTTNWAADLFEELSKDTAKLKDALKGTQYDAVSTKFAAAGRDADIKAALDGASSVVAAADQRPPPAYTGADFTKDLRESVALFTGSDSKPPLIERVALGLTTSPDFALAVREQKAGPPPVTELKVTFPQGTDRHYQDDDARQALADLLAWKRTGAVPQASAPTQSQGGSAAVASPHIRSVGTGQDPELEFMDKYLDAVRQGKAAGGFQDRAVVDLRQLAPDKQVILVGDVHGNIDNLEWILAHNDNEKKLKDGKAVLVFLGDIIHDEIGSTDMTSSFETFKRVAGLKIDHPESVYVVAGNHDFTSQVYSCKKGSGSNPVDQTAAFEDAARTQFGAEWLDKYTAAIFEAPVAVIGKKFFASHAGPPNGADLEAVKNIDARNYATDADTKRLLLELTFSRPVISEGVFSLGKIPAKNRHWFYDGNTIAASLSNIGLPEDSLMINGHTPPWGHVPDANGNRQSCEHETGMAQMMKPPGKFSHHLIHACMSVPGYVTMQDGVFESYNSLRTP